MEKHHRWQLSTDVPGRAQFGADFRGGEALGELTFGRRVDQRAEQDQCFRAKRRSSILVLSHPQ